MFFSLPCPTGINSSTRVSSHRWSFSDCSFYQYAKIKGFIPNNDGNVDVRSHLNRKERSEETDFKKEDLLKAGVIESLYILLSKFWDHELACMASMCTV
ncbi:hypothetical protein CK203_017534 [Vitis vinifera]|uniref:Uncharacterized protein n=1 Tax=Vitis vinifera TaxID=29760 RepID=A0A438IXR9_VITVI|nr:hypothetical protein CK203_017534 [Vitis vinifera]